MVRVPAQAEGAGDNVDALEQLPEEAKAIVRGMGFTKEQLSGPKEFSVLLNILGFQVGKKFRSAKVGNPWATPENDGATGAQYTTDAIQAGRRWVQETNERTFEKTFKVAEKLGEGGYGTVFRAQMGKDKKNFVAVKKSENREERARATNLREVRGAFFVFASAYRRTSCTT